MTIEKGKPSEELEIFDLLKACAQHLKYHKIFQWNENYPTIEHVNRDLVSNSLYCLKKDNIIIGIIVIDENQSPEYQGVNWKYNSDKVLIIHRLAIKPSSQKGGLGKKLMDFALDYAINSNYTSIRLDAYSGNARIIKFYTNRNYKQRGEILFPYRELPFYCFEKEL